MTEEWKLQVSIKSSASKDADMINIRANTADELSVLLEGIGDYSTQIAATSKKIAQAYTVLPLSTTSSTTSTTQVQSYPTIQVSAASDTGVEETVHDRYGNVWVYNKPGAPTCVRGIMVLKSAISKEGKPYKCWSDPAAGPRWSGARIPKEQHAPVVWA